MVSSTHAPELAPCPGLEVPYDGVQLDQDDPEHLPNKLKTTSIFQKEARTPPDLTYIEGRTWIFSRRWTLLVVVITLIIIAVTVGAVVATRRSHRPRSVVDEHEKPHLTSLLYSSASTASLMSNLTSELSQRIMLNTSIASTTCPNGDRWVFIQDQRNDIRAAQRTSQSSVWQVTTNTTIPSTAKPGSPLGASCVQLPQVIEGDLLPGLLVCTRFLL